MELEAGGLTGIMGVAVDPTYPLYPVAASIAAAMLFLVLLTSLIRQSWNLGVAFLCFWLFLDNITLAANAIIWSDNYDVKLYVYCDIGEYYVALCAVTDIRDTHAASLISFASAASLLHRPADHDSPCNSQTVLDCAP